MMTVLIILNSIFRNSGKDEVTILMQTESVRKKVLKND